MLITTSKHIESPPGIPGVRLRPELANSQTAQAWLDQLEGPRPTPVKVGNHVAFDGDARLYYAVREHLARLKGGREESVRRTRDLGLGGPLALKLWEALRIQYPERWAICPRCSGTGKEPDASYCPKCHGPGYIVTLSRE
ncbi:hypothetical protein OJF2_13920 [Aquisphaera giovannonii]|uniref:Uncharacterized protein n=1 Tax=Aquisphaera giovannonii TaxID=406548 RepID=A0A5B9VY44_9BACT|nr:hypothetical protein [Aquisphaera giovannonii]QEH32907.1 hypothetical protein OJF2_13920 [Aquisphaera giovannonii]